MLKHIKGPAADRFRADVDELARTGASEGWRLVNSSVMARVFYSRKQDVYYKEYLPRNRWEWLKAALRGSRCDRARREAQVMIDKGFHTPEILCWGKLSAGREFMISASAAGMGVSERLETYSSGSITDESLREKRQLLVCFGRHIGLLHRRGIVHGDLRAGNVLSHYTEGRWSFSFIDLERNSCHRVLPEKLRKKNLVQLNMLKPGTLTRSDRWRFFKAYWEGCIDSGDEGAAEWLSNASRKSLALAVHRRTIERWLDKTRRQQGR